MTEETQKPKLQVFITDYELGQALDQALRVAIEELVGESLASTVKKAVEVALKQRIEAVADGVIRASIEQTLAEGWSKTNQWGEKIGERATLSSTVRERLEAMAKDGDEYNRRTPSLLNQIVNEKAAEAVKQGLQPLIDEAKKQLQTQLDLSMGKALRLTIADTLKG